MITLSEIGQKLDELPLLPGVVVRLLQLKPDSEDFFDQVLELSQEDPSFALQVIRLSNSANSAPLSKVTSLETAIARVGADAIAGLITSMAVLRVFIPAHQGEKDLWIHALQVALLAKKLAQLNKDHTVDPNEAYLCGLLHDIGRFVLFDLASEELLKVEDENWHTPEELISAERSICGFDHSKLGGKVCARWGLPEFICQVVAFHHIYDAKKQKAIEKHSLKLARLIKTVQLADRYSCKIMDLDDLLTINDHDLYEHLKSCKHATLNDIVIKPKELLELAKTSEAETQKMVSGLGIQ